MIFKPKTKKCQLLRLYSAGISFVEPQILLNIRSTFLWLSFYQQRTEEMHWLTDCCSVLIILKKTTSLHNRGLLANSFVWELYKIDVMQGLSAAYYLIIDEPNILSGKCLCVYNIDLTIQHCPWNQEFICLETKTWIRS